MTNLREKYLMASGFGAGAVTTVFAALLALSIYAPPAPPKETARAPVVDPALELTDEEKADLVSAKERREAVAAAFRGLCVERHGSIISSTAGDVACAWPAASWPPSSVPVVGKF